MYLYIYIFFFVHAIHSEAIKCILSCWSSSDTFPCAAAASQHVNCFFVDACGKLYSASTD